MPNWRGFHSVLNRLVSGTLLERLALLRKLPVLVCVLSALAVLFAWLTLGDGTWLFRPFPAGRPAGYGLGLPGIYLVWLGVIAALYPLCRWFAALKRRRGEWWWTYL